MQCNVMLPDRLFSLAVRLWLTCQIADRRDNTSEICRRLNRQDAEAFRKALSEA